MYGGRIGPGTSDSVAEIAEAVDLLAKEGHNIHFEVFTYSQDERILSKIRSMRNCTTPPPLAHHEMPGKLASMDLLVLPIDFHEEGFRYIRLSMPTKASEYMASGSPILVYAPEETALFKYAHREGWAYSVAKQDTQTLADAILRLYKDPELRQHLGETGKKTAVEHHDAKVVREQYRAALASHVMYQ
jgi:glycosyltransferase involved in cell wall biosynthesis